ncbi:response regulator [Paenibacillus sp. LHD-38]|uniref:response regulator n=1 Tax=Paenibacillus sp. LHD-38 TaxID=3072143 RepID=UPI0028101D63|nr:response regulator [Paenibacillus sp. LHD-38]MDQ8737294.1 response regulator [Paenibacillus sp. LHD-38]
MNKVLIIDDEPWAREVIKALGEWERLKLVIAGEAEDGKSGLRLIDELAPHIVVTDMRMPGTDGVELLKQINERFPLLKIIVMSGYDDFIYLKQAIRSRAVEYLLKPVDPMELNAALQKCVEELEALEHSEGSLRRSPLLFSSVPQTDRYIALKQRALAALFELSKPSALHSLSKVELLLAEAFPGGIKAEQLERLDVDFTDILEQFLGEYSFEGSKVNLPEKRISPCGSLTEVIGKIGNLFSEVIDMLEAVQKTKGNLVIAEVKDYLDKHYLEPIALESVALQFYVSKEHLSRTFKAAAGENLTEYIIRKRMEKARELLLLPHVSIKEAARLTGYSELPYFHRVFKKHFGVTPGDMKSGK